MIGKLLDFDGDAFVNAILKPRVKVGTEWVNKGQNVDQVEEHANFFPIVKFEFMLL